MLLRLCSYYQTFRVNAKNNGRRAYIGHRECRTSISCTRRDNTWVRRYPDAFVTKQLTPRDYMFWSQNVTGGRQKRYGLCNGGVETPSTPSGKYSSLPNSPGPSKSRLAKCVHRCFLDRMNPSCIPTKAGALNPYGVVRRQRTRWNHLLRA